MNVKQINVITLAYLGDAIYEVYVRNYLKGQSNILNYLIDNKYLSDEEIEIVKRGRNYKRETHPKNTDIGTYKMATGFETLIGYLYLDDKKTRIDEIMNLIWEEYNEKDN